MSSLEPQSTLRAPAFFSPERGEWKLKLGQSREYYIRTYGGYERADYGFVCTSVRSSHLRYSGSLIWTVRKEHVPLIYAPSEDSDQPAHSRSLIRVSAGRFVDSEGSMVSSAGQWRLLWDCANAKAVLSPLCLDCTDAITDLSLHWTHI